MKLTLCLAFSPDKPKDQSMSYVNGLTSVSLVNGQEKGKTLRFSPNANNNESGHQNRPENYALFAFMAFSTSMLLFSPLEYLAMLMAIPAIWARA